MPSEFRFHNPEYLWLLLSLPLLYWLAKASSSWSYAKLKRFASSEALKRLIVSPSQGGVEKIRSYFLPLAAMLLLIALARPQGNPVYEEREGASLDIMVLLDVSKSMDAEDVYPSRLKKAKREINHLLDLLSGDRIGIVAFAGSAVLVTPLTSDYDVIRTYMQAIDTDTIQNQGTDFHAAITEAMAALERGGQNAVSADSNGNNVFILMSDGEEHQGSGLETAVEARKKGVTLFSIAFGTEKGVPIPIRNAQGNLLAYKREINGNPVITAVNPGVLKELAVKGGGAFYFSSLDETEIGEILAQTQNLQRGSQKNVRAKIYEEYFFPFLLAGVFFLLLWLSPPWPAVVSKFRNSKARLGENIVNINRKKGLAAVLLLLLPLAAFSAEEKQPEPPLPWYGRLFWSDAKKANERALAKFREQDFASAATALKQLQAEHPESRELSYNLGTTLAKDKHYEDARRLLSSAASGSGLISAKAAINEAGSLGEAKQREQAISSYANIIEKLSMKENPSREEKVLLATAKKNLEHLSESEQAQQQQKEQQQQQQGQGGGQDQKQQKQNQQNSASGKDEKNKDESQAQDKKDDKKEQGRPEQQDQKKDQAGDKQQEQQRYPRRGNGKNPFQERQDLSAEDAKRILDSLKQGEADLQKRFLRNKEKNEEQSSGKDW